MVTQVNIPNEKNPAVTYPYWKIYFENSKDFSIDVLKYLAKEPSKDYITDLVLHWSGSSYRTPSRHYQINICLDQQQNKVFILLADKSHFFDPNVHSHTWHRNTGKIALSFICMYDQKLYPVTKEMTHLMAETAAILCTTYELDAIKNIKDHEVYAAKDGYAGQRWDTKLKLNDSEGKETLTDRVIRYTKEILKSKNAIYKAKEIKEPVVVKNHTSFNDVFTIDWFSKCTEYLYKNNILKGYTEDNQRLFKPSLHITRAESCVFLTGLVKFLNSKMNLVLSLNASSYNPFTDVKATDYYADEVSIMYNLGIIHGINTNTFAPDNNLTRAEIASLLYELLAFISKRKTLNLPAITSENFIDINVNQWAYKQISICSSLSLMIGYKEETGHFFHPDYKLTRAEFAATCYKLIKYFQDINLLKM